MLLFVHVTDNLDSIVSIHVIYETLGNDHILHLHMNIRTACSHLGHIGSICIRNAAAHQTDIHNIAHQSRQLQFTQGLHQQQTDDCNHSLPMRLKQLYDFQHSNFLSKRS